MDSKRNKSIDELDAILAAGEHTYADPPEPSDSYLDPYHTAIPPQELKIPKRDLKIIRKTPDKKHDVITDPYRAADIKDKLENLLGISKIDLLNQHGQRQCLQYAVELWHFNVNPLIILQQAEDREAALEREKPSQECFSRIINTIKTELLIQLGTAEREKIERKKELLKVSDISNKLEQAEKLLDEFDDLHSRNLRFRSVESPLSFSGDSTLEREMKDFKIHLLPEIRKLALRYVRDIPALDDKLDLPTHQILKRCATIGDMDREIYVASNILDVRYCHTRLYNVEAKLTIWTRHLHNVAHRKHKQVLAELSSYGIKHTERFIASFLSLVNPSNIISIPKFTFFFVQGYYKDIVKFSYFHSLGDVREEVAREPRENSGYLNTKTLTPLVHCSLFKNGGTVQINIDPINFYTILQDLILRHHEIVKYVLDEGISTKALNAIVLGYLMHPTLLFLFVDPKRAEEPAPRLSPRV